MKENGIICNKCGEFKNFDLFEENARNNTGYYYSCIECREKEKIQITEEEKNIHRNELEKIFFEDELIQNNLKILGEKFIFSDEDKFIFFLNKGYDKKWLEQVFDNTYRIIYKNEDGVIW